MFQNPILFALVTYGLTLLIALAVAGIITAISWATKSRDKKAVQGE